MASMFLASMTPEQRANESERLRSRARNVDLAFRRKDSDRASGARQVPVLKVDGRKNNQGVARRQSRSYGFKAKVIKDYERYHKLLPDMKGCVASVVADVWSLSEQQVRLYIRQKADILEKARSVHTRHK